MTIHGANLDSSGAETRQGRIRRTMFGALYGFLGAITFVLISAFIDILLHPELPLGVNWSALTMRAPLIILGLALVGAVTCWWQETWQGLVSGAAVAAALALITSLFSSQVNTGMKFMVLFFTLVPVAVMALPVAYFLRWVIERHGQALQMNGRGRRLAGLVILVIAVGAALGLFMKPSGRAIEAARFIHNFLQDLSAEDNPLADVPGVVERRDVLYTMYSTKSESSTEGFDIHVEYSDDYEVLCTVILYPGRIPFFSGCQPVE